MHCECSSSRARNGTGGEPECFPALTLCIIQSVCGRAQTEAELQRHRQGARSRKEATRARSSAWQTENYSFMTKRKLEMGERIEMNK